MRKRLPQLILAAALAVGTAGATAGVANAWDWTTPGQGPTAYRVHTEPNLGSPTIRLYNPNCGDIHVRTVENGQGMWYNLAGGWVLNDGWCI